MAVASIVANCAGVESNQNRCLGQREFREFLEDYQEEHLEDEDIIELIQVCLCQIIQMDISEEIIGIIGMYVSDHSNRICMRTLY